MDSVGGEHFMVRPYQASDFAPLHALDQQCFSPEIAYSPHELRYFLEAKDSLTLVAEEIGAPAQSIAGFVLAQMYRARPTFQARLITLDVAPALRRQRLGAMLLTACETELRLRQVRQLRLEVAVSNVAAQALYQSYGYEYVTRIARYYPTGEDALAMQKRL
jgi:ribosomal-protein-alanine N-acetyltransferase